MGNSVGVIVFREFLVPGFNLLACCRGGELEDLVWIPVPFLLCRRWAALPYNPSWCDRRKPPSGEGQEDEVVYSSNRPENVGEEIEGGEKIDYRDNEEYPRRERHLHSRRIALKLPCYKLNCVSGKEAG